MYGTRKDQLLCHATNARATCVFNANKRWNRAKSRQRWRKIPGERNHANNATCYAYFLADHGLERCQQLRQSYFVEATSAVCIYRILSRAGCNGCLPNGRCIRRHFGHGWSGGHLRQHAYYAVQGLLITPPYVLLGRQFERNWEIGVRARWKGFNKVVYKGEAV